MGQRKCKRKKPRLVPRDGEWHIRFQIIYFGPKLKQAFTAEKGPNMVRKTVALTRRAKRLRQPITFEAPVGTKDSSLAQRILRVVLGEEQGQLQQKIGGDAGSLAWSHRY